MEKGQEQDGSVTAEILRMEDERIEAYPGGDVEGFAYPLTDDFVYTSERGVFDKQSYVRNIASGLIEMRGPRNSDHEVRLHGPTAISTGAAALDPTYGGRDISEVDRFARVWANEHGIWRAAALHANNVPKEA